jgi:hypothetical protein
MLNPSSALAKLIDMSSAVARKASAIGYNHIQARRRIDARRSDGGD